MLFVLRYLTLSDENVDRIVAIFWKTNFTSTVLTTEDTLPAGYDLTTPERPRHIGESAVAFSTDF